MNTEQTERAIKWFKDSCEPPCSDICEQCEMENIALAALRAQQEQQNPLPLTVGELKERVGKPVWLQDVEKPIVSEWKICIWDRGKYLSLVGVHQRAYLIEEYGYTWLTYDHEPKRAQE